MSPCSAIYSTFFHPLKNASSLCANTAVSFSQQTTLPLQLHIHIQSKSRGKYSNEHTDSSSRLSVLQHFIVRRLCNFSETGISERCECKSVHNSRVCAGNVSSKPISEGIFKYFRIPYMSGIIFGHSLPISRYPCYLNTKL